VTGDVFEEDPFRFDLADDAGNVWPQVPIVVGSAPLSGVTEWLAGVACEDGVESPSERSPVEGGDVIPYRGWSEVSCPLGGDDGLSGILFPFDKTAGVESRLGEHEAHIEAATTCAEGESVSGR